MWNGLEKLETLDLEYNCIATIFPEAFSSLIYLKTLILKRNRVSEIKSNMWILLHNLRHLDLSHNYFRDIPRHGFSHMPSVHTLNLNKLSLRTLKPDIFNPADYPDSNGRPARFGLWLDTHGFQCDTSLCWLKEAVTAGSIFFPNSGSPKCYNLAEIPFEAVKLDSSAGRYHLFRPLGS